MSTPHSPASKGTARLGCWLFLAVVLSGCASEPDAPAHASVYTPTDLPPEIIQAAASGVVFYDVRAGKRGKEIGTAAVEDPRGMAFDAKGRLDLIIGTRILRYAAPDFTKARLGKAETATRSACPGCPE